MRGFYRLVPFLLGAASAAGCVGASENESVDTQESPVNAAADGDYVRTPFGLRHKDCVHDVGDDAVMDSDGTVTHPDGTKAHIDCTHDAPLEEPTTDGWVMTRSYSTPSWTKKMIATFTVPHSPHDASKLIYLFPGMTPESRGSIIQTVLSFGYGGPHWSISSWDCGGGPNGSCPHSAMKTVNPGDVIHATMVGSSCYSTGRCLWTITTKDTTTGVATTLTTARQPAMSWAFGGALEAYGLDYCDQYPESGSESFSSIH